MNTRIHKIILAGGLCVLFLLGGCCNMLDSCEDENGRYTASEDFNYWIDLEDQTGLAFAGFNGVVSIAGWDDTAHARVEGTRIVRSPHSEEDAWNRLEDLQVEITEGDDDLAVVTLQPEHSNGLEYTINYIISVPYTWTTALTHMNGDILIEHMKEKISAGLINGQVVVHDHRGGLDIAVTNGGLDAQSELPDEEVWAVTVMNGSIDLAMPQSTSAEFSAVVTNGLVQVSGLSLQNMTQTSKTVTGVLGDGSGEIALVMTNGQIQVTGVETN